MDTDFYKVALERLGLVEITKWWCHKSNTWQFNHIEYGHCKNAFPTPIDTQQEKAWKGLKWTKRYVYGDTSGPNLRIVE